MRQQLFTLQHIKSKKSLKHTGLQPRQLFLDEIEVYALVLPEGPVAGDTLN